MSEPANQEVSFEQAVETFKEATKEPDIVESQPQETAPAEETSKLSVPDVVKTEEKVTELDPRIKALLDKEAQIDSKIAELKQLIEQNKPAQEKPKSKPKFRNWADFIRSEHPDVDLGRVAEEIWYSTVDPEKRPPEYKAKQELSSAYSEFSDMKTEMSSKLAELEKAQSQLAYNNYKNELSVQLTRLNNDKYPLVTAVLKAKPSLAVEQAMGIAESVANTEQRVLTHEQIAEAYEKWLGGFKSEYEFLFASSTGKSPKSDNSLYSTQLATKQPPKALIDPNDDDALFKRALIEAGLPEAEAIRQTARRKRGRPW